MYANTNLLNVISGFGICQVFDGPSLVTPKTQDIPIQQTQDEDTGPTMKLAPRKDCATIQPLFTNQQVNLESQNPQP